MGAEEETKRRIKSERFRTIKTDIQIIT